MITNKGEEMRETKFRGFDKENNCWRYGFYTKLQEGARRFNSIIVDDPETGLARYYIHSSKTITQYTGLKDKNGKEIYEGDIVMYARESNMTIECTMVGPHAIGWNNSESHFKLIGAPVHGRLIHKAYEIIGNIHENPELLIEEK